MSVGFERFLAEARRRKVHRSAAIYVGLAIPILEAADLLAPVLLLPEWAYRALGAAVLLGFPVALLASWTFDLTREGVERTEPTPKTGSPSTPPPPERPRRRIAFAVLAALIVVMGSLGWSLGTSQTVELDERTVAILPFRVSAEPSLDYLGEGLMDLLAAQLPGDVGPRALDPGVILSRLADRHDLDNGVVPRREAIEMARDLGAAAVLLGSVVGARDRIVVDATLYESHAGRESAHLRADAPEDSLRVLVDRLALELLAQTADGEPRLASELTDSLRALRAYLRGQTLARQGQFYPAMEALEEALAVDSTFAKAAIAFDGVACWTFECGRARSDRARRLAWAHRDRLSSYDRLWLEADQGVSSPAERLAVRQRLAQTRPDDPAAWYRLAWSTFQWGAWLGLEDTEQLAAEHVRRSLDLGARLGGGIQNAGFILYFAGDTANLRRISGEFLQSVDSGDLADWVRWVLATATGDSATVAAVVSRMPSMSAEVVTRFMRFASQTGDGIESADSAAAEVDRRIRRSSAPDFTSGAIELQTYQTDRGRPRAARRTRQRWGPGRSDVIVSEWLWGGFEAEDLDESLLALWAEGTSDTEIRPAGLSIRAFYRCWVELARLRRDLVLPDHPDRAVRDPMAADPRNDNEPYWAHTAEMCSALLEAWQAVADRRPEGARLVARADSILLESRPMYVGLRYGAPLELAWLKEELGDVPGALSTVRRRIRGTFLLLFTATRVREEGRLAALNGDIDGALRAYRHYLALRSDPEPKLETEVAQVRAEYERLLASRR